ALQLELRDGLAETVDLAAELPDALRLRRPVGAQRLQLLLALREPRAHVLLALMRLAEALLERCLEAGAGGRGALDLRGQASALELQLADALAEPIELRAELL